MLPVPFSSFFGSHEHEKMKLLREQEPFSLIIAMKGKSARGKYTGRPGECTFYL